MYKLALLFVSLYLFQSSLADNSYLVVAPKLFKVGYENEISCMVTPVKQPVDFVFELVSHEVREQTRITVRPGETKNVTLSLPKNFPCGLANLTIVGQGGVQFTDRREVIVYDNNYVLLVETSASVYRPGDLIQFRVVATDEQLIPVQNGDLIVEIYDSHLKMVGEFKQVPIRDGLTDIIEFPLSHELNMGNWLVSATLENTTSSVPILISQPITPSFDLKVILPRFLLRTEKFARGIIEIGSDWDMPIFGRANITIAPITEQDLLNGMPTDRVLGSGSYMKSDQKGVEVSREEERAQYQRDEELKRGLKMLTVEVAGRFEFNYDLAQVFGIDLSKTLAVSVYIECIELRSGQQRIVKNIIPIFSRDIIYNVRPLEFQAGEKNEYQITAKRPDGKPVKMEEVVVNVTMLFEGDQEKSIEITDLYTRGRNDIGLFNVDIPENCIGLLVSLTPIAEDGKLKGFRTHTVPMMPLPKQRETGGAKLTIEMEPAEGSSATTGKSVVSTVIPQIGKPTAFYVQLLPSKQTERLEQMPVNYILLTNGRITSSGVFMIKPTKECSSKQTRAIHEEPSRPPRCVLNGQVEIMMTREMVPYSTLLCYTFNSTVGINVVESYRFTVHGLFQSNLTLNSTIGKQMISEEMISADWKLSTKAKQYLPVDLTFVGTPESIVGYNVIEYAGIVQGLPTDITKERLLRYLTTYESVPVQSMPLPTTTTGGMQETVVPRETSGESESEELSHSARKVSDEDLVRREQQGQKLIYPIEKLVFGSNMVHPLKPVDGDDSYLPQTNMDKFYGVDSQCRGSGKPKQCGRRMRLNKQGDVNVAENDLNVLVGMPTVLAMEQEQAMMMQAEEAMKEQQQSGKGGESMEGERMDVGSDHGDHSVNADLRPAYGSNEWYKRMDTKLGQISKEAFVFMHSGLAVISDFVTLRVPKEIQRLNYTSTVRQYLEQTKDSRHPFGIRDAARQLLEEYIKETDAGFDMPMILLEEQSRAAYYKSWAFNQTRLDGQGQGKVRLPRLPSTSTWLATGFSLNEKAGLGIAHPLRLGTPQGLYLLCEVPHHVLVGEHVLLACGINNLLEKDVQNVVLRIKPSADFDLIEMQPSTGAVSDKITTLGSEFVSRIPSMKIDSTEIRNFVIIPKRRGVLSLVIEVESELAGDYEVVTLHSKESGIYRKQLSYRLFDLMEKKTVGPIVEKIVTTPELRCVEVCVSGTMLDKLNMNHSMKTNSLIGVDRALANLWQLTLLGRYLNETEVLLQREIPQPLYNMTRMNLTRAYQRVQSFANINGSYAFIYDKTEMISEEESSLYLTTFAMGAMLSPVMPVRDNVTLNRTLNYILSHQRPDGSFEDTTPCYHKRFCTGEYRREAMTSLIYYMFHRDNITKYVPEFIRERLYAGGEQSPMKRAERYLISRMDQVKNCMLTTSLLELALLQCNKLPTPLREQIRQRLESRQFQVLEDGSKFLKITEPQYTTEDRLLLNALTSIMYSKFGNFKTVFDMSRWIVSERNTHYKYDSLLDAVFHTSAWVNADWLLRRQLISEGQKFNIVVDVTTDNGQRRQFHIDESNMDITQKWNLTLPVQQISYTVSGHGYPVVDVKRVYIEKEQRPSSGVMTPATSQFNIQQEFQTMPWLSEIKAKTCLTYSPTAEQQKTMQKHGDETMMLNNTVVLDVHIPSGCRVNLRQIDFFLAKYEQVAYFKYDYYRHKITFFFRLPTEQQSKPFCFEWPIERLSTVVNHQPIAVCAYDYLRPEIAYKKLFPVSIQPMTLGYQYIEQLLRQRPSIETILAEQMKHARSEDVQQRPKMQ